MILLLICFTGIFSKEWFQSPILLYCWLTHAHAHTYFAIIYMVIFMETFQGKRCLFSSSSSSTFPCLFPSQRENELKQCMHYCWWKKPIFGINASINMMFHIFYPINLFLVRILYTYFIFFMLWHIFRRIKSIFTHFFKFTPCGKWIFDKFWYISRQASVKKKLFKNLPIQTVFSLNVPKTIKFENEFTVEKLQFDAIISNSFPDWIKCKMARLEKKSEISFILIQ